MTVVVAACVVASGTPPLPSPPPSSHVGTADSAADEWILDEDGLADIDDSDADLALAANWAADDPQASPAAAGPQAPPQAATGLTAPRIGTAANPFANTCDGKSIGFVTAAGEAPRFQLSGAPATATYSCRTGPAASVGRQPFAACDGSAGTQPVHTPRLTTEGAYRTEVRYTVNNQTSTVASVSYYAHHSLDRVACCSSAVADAALFAAAQTAIPSTDRFANARLDNPFIEIPRPERASAFGNARASRVLSLRRAFRLSGDGRYLLIRRTMASRRTRERTGQNSCVGLRLAEPVLSTRLAKPVVCNSHFPRQQAYDGGLVDSRCPNIYCTVSTCTVGRDGCRRITHRFNRGPNQAPWIVNEMLCPEPVLSSFTSHECDAYVVNAKGQAACLAVTNGRVTVRKAFTDDKGTGLRLLEPLKQAAPGQPTPKGQYVFSAKATKANVKNALFLPN